MIETLALDAFLEQEGLLIDARSPGEFAQGHIPGAVNLPLLDNEQRVLVGTCYKEKGREAAVELGFELVGPQFARIAREGKALANGQPVRVFCWRGGLRSNILAWVLQTAGLKVTLLQGGYKGFRNHSLALVELSYQLRILGGLTGSGKTDILQQLKEKGEQVLDLEALANHRGSSYGKLGLPPQPTVEQFENLMAWELARLNRAEPIWVEDESRRIGTCALPKSFYDAMQKAPLFLVERPLEERLAIIRRDYGTASSQDLAIATERIRKRLGGERTQQALDLIEEGRFDQWVQVVLEYYDRTYRYHLSRRDNVHRFDLRELSIGAATAV